MRISTTLRALAVAGLGFAGLTLAAVPAAAAPAEPEPATVTYDVTNAATGSTIAGSATWDDASMIHKGTVEVPAGGAYVDILRYNHAADKSVIDMEQVSAGAVSGTTFEFGPLEFAKPTGEGQFTTARIIVSAADYSPLVVIDCNQSKCAQVQ
ncbi:hypothetical protein ACQEU5_10010 [Marinactinospora thermotolerans]|uniref:Uncharacterized protein n=1 Tax=Marinactinospora thermotolerans DSM 45154 TaxID=1122192 RepID=A0A1T4N5Z2_9ACTN|nr:hypothetical protein [Marinactinospora thermotolerans]SJZ74729.1 hypothetical protein SAMN02745673_01294 [Marinactinospora thermotolerans DSM 45154]